MAYVKQLDAGTYEIGKKPGGELGFLYVITSGETSVEYYVLLQPNTYPISLDKGQELIFGMNGPGSFTDPIDFYNWACEQLQTYDVNCYEVEQEWSTWNP